MESLLFSGSQAGIRKLCILAHRGCLSLPPEVEIPIKARIDHRVSEVWSKWGTFSSGTDDLERCPPWREILVEDGTQTPLAYELPEGGSVIGVMGTCDEDDDAFVLVQGKDITGREIYMPANGEQLPGEKFKIKKGTIRFGSVSFGEITGVIKSKTNGYVSLFAVDPQRQSIRQFLADWNPSEEKPLYRKFRIVTAKCSHRTAHLSMLCRVRLKDNYHDNELTLFDNSLAIILAAQRIQSEINNDSQTAGFKKQGLEDILDKEASYKKKAQGPVDVFYALSGGSIKNIF